MITFEIDSKEKNYDIFKISEILTLKERDVVLYGEYEYYYSSTNIVDENFIVLFFDDGEEQYEHWFSVIHDGESFYINQILGEETYDFLE